MEPEFRHLTDDPLARIGPRFSLSTAYGDLPFSVEPPSGLRTRLFVLRVAGAPAPRRSSVLPTSRYCPDRQMGVTADARALPSTSSATTAPQSAPRTVVATLWRTGSQIHR